MFGFLILIISVLALNILSKIFVQRLFTFLYKITKNDKKATVLLGFIFLPGTFVHEISHFISALFLLVPVGQLNLMPEVVEGGVKLGSVSIGKTDFIRKSVIGIAPLLIGGTIIFWSLNYIFVNNLWNWWIVVGLIYIIFQLSHTMFSSKKDLEAVIELFIFIILISIVLVVFKIYSPFVYIYNFVSMFSDSFLKLSYYLSVPILIEIFFLGIFKNKPRI